MVRQGGAARQENLDKHTANSAGHSVASLRAWADDKEATMNGRVWLSLFLVSVLSIVGTEARADPQIFRCESQGRVTYSDIACADAVDKMEVATTSLNSYSADEPPKRSAHIATAKPVAHRSGSIAEEQLRHKERCKDLAEQLDSISAKLWADDPGRKHQAHIDRLHEQQKKLERQRSAEKCR
jgi:hypothetical protein